MVEGIILTWMRVLSSVGKKIFHGSERDEC